MAITVKKITLWRREVENRSGTLAQALRPLAGAAASLQVIMAYRFPGDPARGAVELCPVSGKRSQAAAREAGLSPSDIPSLLALGDDRPGLGSETTRTLADAGINLTFMVAQVIGRKFSCVYGFESEDDARKAAGIIRKAGQRKKR